MPYVDNSARAELDPSIRLLCSDLDKICTPGNLNYVFTCLADWYTVHQGLSYATLNEVVGVFESAKAEFQRRVVAEYEDQKISANGDVYSFFRRIGGPLAGPIPGLWVNFDEGGSLHPSGLSPATVTVVDHNDLPEEIVDEGPPRQTWMRCRHPQCDLHLVGPGRIDCAGYCIDDDEDWNQ